MMNVHEPKEGQLPTVARGGYTCVMRGQSGMPDAALIDRTVRVLCFDLQAGSVCMIAMALIAVSFCFHS